LEVVVAGAGLVVVGVEVVGVEVEVVLEGVVVVTLADGVVAVVVWQLAVTLETGGVPAGSICAGGVPGEALTVKVSVWPSSRVAVTVHSSAEAVGMAATASTTSTSPTVVIATFSLWLIDTVVYFLPPRTWTAPNTAGRGSGTLTGGRSLCNGEPSLESAVSAAD
jgi:hypothetical protein